MDHGANNCHHMDILVGSHTTIRNLHGEQGDVWERFLRGDVAARDVQKGNLSIFSTTTNIICKSNESFQL